MYTVCEGSSDHPQHGSPSSSSASSAAGQLTRRQVVLHFEGINHAKLNWLKLRVCSSARLQSVIVFMIYAKIENKSDCIGGGIPWRIRGNPIDYWRIATALLLRVCATLKPPESHKAHTQVGHQSSSSIARQVQGPVLVLVHKEH